MRLRKDALAVIHNWPCSAPCPFWFGLWYQQVHMGSEPHPSGGRFLWKCLLCEGNYMAVTNGGKRCRIEVAHAPA